MTKKQFIIYAAGLFDGEGYIVINKTLRPKEKRAPQYLLLIGITMTDLPPLELFKENFGGYLFKGKKAWNHLSKRPVYRWTLYAQKAVDFLKTIYPYTILKKPQIEIGIEFQKHKNGINGRRRTGVNGQLTESILSYRQNLFKKLRNLKHINDYSADLALDNSLSTSK